MSLNKNASFRYRIIDKSLKAYKNGISRNDLIEKISAALSDEFGIENAISERTFYGDINIMRSLPPRGFNAPIICKNSLYTYSDPSFDIFQSDLSEKDVQSIEEAVILIKQLGLIEGIEGLENLLYRVKASKKFEVNPYLSVDSNLLLKGIEHIASLYNAVKESRYLSVLYKAYREEERNFKVEPYMLREFNNRWYLIAYEKEFDDFINLALDRMISIKVEEECFVRREDVDLVQRFGEIIGITFQDSQEIQKIIFRLKINRAPYVETKPIHKTQRIRKKTKSYFEFELNVRINKELISEFASYGMDLTVMKPLSLRNDMRDIHLAAYLQYKDD